jgi:SAM-dependent methyltransferase
VTVSRARDAATHRLRLARGAALDALDRLTGRRDPLVPPRRRVTGDYSEYRRIGEEFLGHFVRLGGLQPGDRVLDVGCGPGRMAAPLTRYLESGARYEGFDVVAREVDWCRRNITPHHPSFRFQLLDVRNPHYNPVGSVEPEAVELPYGDASFDFAFATSVFTHMLGAPWDRYLRELARVLAPGGRFLFTYFLLNEDSRARIARGTSHFDFAHGEEPVRWNDPGDPEATVAYDEATVLVRHAEHGLPVSAVHHGYWDGRAEFVTWQDVAVGSRSR